METTAPHILRANAPRRSQAAPADNGKSKLLDQLREALRSRHYSRRTEQTYCHWVKRYVHFHNVRHPAEMAEPEINAFLTHLAVKEKVSASTQNPSGTSRSQGREDHHDLHPCPEPGRQESRGRFAEEKRRCII